MGKPSIDLCGDGVKVTVVRTPHGFALDVPDNHGKSGDSVLMPCALNSLWQGTRGLPLNLRAGDAGVSFKADGPLIEVRFQRIGDKPHRCEVFRRDYTKALVDLVVDD